MSEFKAFACKAERQFAAMSKHELYQVNVSGDELWETYLGAFPEGTNPIFRVRTEHDGSYDRGVIKRIGNVVRICPDGTLMSIWDEQYSAPYDTVASVLAGKVRKAAITGLFRMKERSIGCVENREPATGLVFNHLHATIARRHQAAMPGEAMGEANAVFGVFKRGLEEITPAALEEIINMKDTLYRGAEFCPQAKAFRDLQRQYSGQRGDTWIWANIGHGLAKFRNTVIGTLAVDLSGGMDLEAAVRAFESKVAPTNYKRPTALITQGMVDKALKTIRDLDLEPALDRRYARLSDVSVNNVLWVANTAKGQMKDGVAGLLEGAVTRKASAAGETEIGIEELMRILPECRSLEMLVKNRHQKNLVSITTGGGAPLFKWDNAFAWSYNGDITDAIKERVKAAGGNVHADLRVSLAWFNHDDLDLHCVGPYGHVYYGDKMGILDVDMNVSNLTRTPVENLAFVRPRNGSYRIQVVQFNRREVTNLGFTLEIECGGEVQQLSYEKAVAGTQECIEFTMHNGAMQDFKVVNKELKHQGLAQVVWGVQTETFTPVSTVMLSPNFWDGRAIGNKHWFFLLEGCANPNAARGIYNEFLRADLEPHRKVFEVLGSKTKCQTASEQLSGLGFSSTIRESVTVRAIGQTINKLYKINF